MFFSIRKLIADRITFWGFAASFFLLIIFFVAVFFFTPLQQSVVALHYNVYFGTDLLGPAWAYLMPVALSFLFWLINLLLSFWAIERELLAARLLAWFSGWLVAIILFATSITKWFLK